MKSAKKSKEAPPAPPAPPPVREMSFLAPVASDEELIAGFKRYVALKDKLLEPGDYSWIVKFKAGDKERRKFHSNAEKAKSHLDNLLKERVEAELEKKIRKSGVLKLGKAFSISDEIVEEKLLPDTGYALYKIRATAPNGQYKERTGSCSGREPGRSDSPFDHIQATALTRASNRAVMALLGGETTAEEWGEDVPHEAEEKPPAPPAPPPPPPPAPPPSPPPAPPAAHPCDVCGATDTTATITGEPKRVFHLCPKCMKLNLSEIERLVALNEKFAKSKPAAQDDTTSKLYKRIFAVTSRLYGKEGEAKLHQAIEKKYQKTSLKSLDIPQLEEVAKAFEEFEAKKLKK